MLLSADIRLQERMLALQKESQSVRREYDLDRAHHLESEIDKRVNVLYGLSQKEIKIVEGK